MLAQLVSHERARALSVSASTPGPAAGAAVSSSAEDLSIGLCVRPGDDLGLATCLNNWGVALQALGKYDKAWEALSEVGAPRVDAFCFGMGGSH